MKESKFQGECAGAQRKKKWQLQGASAEQVDFRGNLLERALNQFTRTSELALESIDQLPKPSYDPARPRICYLHFGTPKTGTTSIQNCLFQIGARDDWVYVHAGAPNSSRHCGLAFGGKDAKGGKLLGSRGAEVAQEAKNLIRKAFKAYLDVPANRYILSAESLSTIRQKDLSELIEWLKQSVDQVIAVGYVRPLKGLFESAFQQSNKGEKRAAPTFVGFDVLAPKYRSRIEKFDLVLGRDQVIIGRFDRALLKDGDVVQDFANLVGIRIHPQESYHSNESLTLDGLRFLHLYRKAVFGHQNMKKFSDVIKPLLALARMIKGEKIEFANSIIDELAVAHAEDLKWMEDRLNGERLHTPGMPNTPNQIINVSPDMMEEFTPSIRAVINEFLNFVGEPLLPADPSAAEIDEAMQRLTEDKKALNQFAESQGKRQETRRRRPAWMLSTEHFEFDDESELAAA